MDLLHRDLLLIPYGSAGFFAEKMKLTGFSLAGLELWAASPCVLIDKASRQPLRCHQMPADFSPPPPAEEMRETAGKLGFMRQHLQSLCGVWQGPPKTFLEAYFAAVKREIAANSEELSDRIAGLDGLAGIDDFVFSAPLPLPRAHLHLAPRSDAPVVRSEDVVAVDFAFWTGHRLLAVAMETGATPTPKQRRAWDCVAAYGIDTLRVKPKDLVEANRPADVLGNDFARFWDGDPMPRTPFRGPRIADPVTAV